MTKLEELNAEQKKLEQRLEEIKRERVALASAVKLGPMTTLKQAPKDGSWVLICFDIGCYLAVRWNNGDGNWVDSRNETRWPSDLELCQPILRAEGGAA